jgi:putative transposase
VVSLPQKRQAVVALEEKFSVSTRRACKVIGIHRSTMRRTLVRALNEQELVKQIRDLSETYTRWGYRKVHAYLRTKGVCVGREHVRLIRKREGLQVARKQRRKRHLPRSQTGLLRAAHPNHVWSYDFIEDATADGKRLRFLNVVDECTRECLAIECSRSQNWGKVKAVLQRLFAKHGIPQFIRSDNGPEFIARALRAWLSSLGVQTTYIEPGSPWENPYVESFNGIFRDGCLNRWLFFTPKEAQELAEQWRYEYNFERPHGALGGITPSIFAQGVALSNASAVA